MKLTASAAALVVLALAACEAAPTPTASPSPSPDRPTLTTPAPTAAPRPATPTPAPATPTPTPEGRTIIVSTTADDGPGSLRQALLEAQPFDTILFDPTVYPPDEPQAIHVESPLPHVTQGHLTIDASDAGVILDGSRMPRDSWVAGLEMVSDGNTVRGLQVINFTGTGLVASGSRGNTIGGDRSIGAGPAGQGNVLLNNNFGVGLWNRAIANTVTGNLIGITADGREDGNWGSGMWVTEYATDNLIGPDNVIAFSARCGIEVDGPRSLRNTITANSIYASGRRGICLLIDSNDRLPAPLVTHLDHAAGRITGTACAGCSVEIFSSGQAYEGAVPEGRTTADSDGIFTYAQGAPFAGIVSLTATDSHGNTSEFSRPGAATLQERNERPFFPLAPKRSGELADNRAAARLEGPQLWIQITQGLEQEYLRDLLLDLGIKRLDTSVIEQEPPITWDAEEFHIPREYDQLIDVLRANGVTINYQLHFWDKAGHARGETLSTPRFQADEQQLGRFLDYVRFIVRHFKGRVAYYTIWTEPDYCGDGGIKCITRPDYIELVRRTVPAIREEDPQAKIVAAPTVFYFSHPYTLEIMSSDVARLFDAVQWHAQYDVRPDNTFYGSYYYDYPAIVDQIRQAAEAAGFRGEYWSTEMGWASAEFPGGAADQPYILNTGSDRLAAKYKARGIIGHLGIDVSPGIDHGIPRASGWMYPVTRLVNTIMAGARPTSIEVDFSTDAQRVRPAIHAFELPSGERHVALWDDRAAGEEDGTLTATLTIPGVIASFVAGIDVLYGFEQELLAELSEDGDLVIPNLLVRDYPIIIRLVP